MSQLVSPRDARQDFMSTLGLLPPYSLDDVHKAYKARAREVHPDRGGSTADFLKLQEAYGRAQEYAKFQEGRRLWLANQVEPYLVQQEIVAEVERRGGQAQVESLDWMERSFGDFAVLAERLRGITLRNCADGDEFLRQLASQAKSLRYLGSLDVAYGAISDAGLKSLLELPGLERINLAGTRVTAAGLAELAGLSELKWLNIAGTSLGWWARWQLARRLPGVTLVAAPGV